MKIFPAHRPLAAMMLIVLMLVLSLQLAQARPVPVGPDAVDSAMTSMPSHCGDCIEASLIPDCADGLCGGLAAMIGCDGPPGAVHAPSAAHARIPLYHPGPGTAPEPQPPRMPIPA